MKTDFKNEWLCESCGAKKGSFGAGYTQEMEDDLMAFSINTPKMALFYNLKKFVRILHGKEILNQVFFLIGLKV